MAGYIALGEKMQLGIKVDVEEVQNALSVTNKSLKSIKRSTLLIAAKSTAKQVKALIAASDLQTRTGELKRAYTYRVKKDVSSAVVYPKAISGKNTIYPKAMTLSYGHDGPTVRASHWTIRPRGFVQGGEKYAAEESYLPAIQKMIDKELEKFWS